MKHSSNRRLGFTIIELVVVIAVVAIMTAVLVPIFSNVIGKANDLGEAVSSREVKINAIIDGGEAQTPEGTTE